MAVSSGLKKRVKYVLVEFNVHVAGIPKYNTPPRIRGIPKYNTPPRIRGIPKYNTCLLYTSPSPRDGLLSRMPSSA